MTVISAVIIYTYPGNATFAYQIAIGVCGIWWFTLSLPVWKYLGTRPGPQLPISESNYIWFSWKKMYYVFRHYKRLPNTFIYLVCYFVFSDSVSTLGSVAILFAQSNLRMTSSQIAVALLIAPFAAITGSYMWLYLSRRYLWSTKKTLMIVLACCSFLPIYGTNTFY